MTNNGQIDLFAAFNKLLAENKSQETRLDENAKIIGSRENEIEMLQTMLSEANEFRSSVDNQLMELKELRSYIDDLQQQVAGSGYMGNGGQHSPMGSSRGPVMQSLKPTYASMQSQLSILEEELLEMNKRNLLLQQQTSRIAELESLLANDVHG